ncbi:MAG: HlyD family efflux transporter periplasmic adaptor subunit [Candidatus Gracilibacteria bacterium]
MNFLKKNYKWLLGVLVIAGVIAVVKGAGESASAVEYETTTIGSGSVQATVSVVGSVTPKKEIQLSFQNSGRIQTLNVKEGDRVSSGQVLAEINTDDIQSQIARDEAAVAVSRAQLEKTLQGIKLEDRQVLQTSISNAERSLAQAQSSYKSTQASSQADIAAADTALTNAKKVFDATSTSNETVNTKDIQTFQAAVANSLSVLAATQAANVETVKSSQSGVESAQVALNNTKKNLETGIPVQDKNVSKAQEDSFYNSVNYLNEVDNSLRAINNIITVEEYNKDANRAYRELLGVQKQHSYNTTVNAYYILKKEFNDNKSLFVITDRTLSYGEIVARLEKLKTLLDNAFNTLSTTYEMVSNSLTSRDLSQSTLDAFRTSILAQRTAVTNALSALSNIKKNVESLELQRTSNVTTLQNAVDTAEKSLDSAKQSLENVRAQAVLSETNAKNNLKTAQDNVEKAKAGLSSKELTVINAQNAYAAAQKNLESALARADSQLQTAQNSVVSAQSQLSTAQAQLAAQTAPARAADIQVAQAQVKQAEATLASTRTRLGQTQLIAPGQGTVTTIPVNIGEQAGPSTIAVRMISEDVNIIEANVAETEVGKVAVGQKVLIDFDAFSVNDKYQGTVAFINQDKTVQDGVIYYRIQVTFNTKEFAANNIRPGMTANLNVITSELSGIVTVSNQALKEEFKDGVSSDYVEVAEMEGSKQNVVKKFVQLGVRGDSTSEVLSGLTESDQIILFTKTANE